MNIFERTMELVDFSHSRRGHVAGSTRSGAAASSAFGLGKMFAQDLTDVDILQFALTLEHLEARMYTDMLATGILEGKEMQYFQDFGDAEAAHVQGLTDALSSIGETPAAAQESYNFPPFENRGDILNFAKTAEDIGVGAYTGAANLISNKDYLAVAGSIVQVEARHAAIANLLIGLDSPVPAAFTPTLTVPEVLEMVGPILGS